MLISDPLRTQRSRGTAEEAIASIKGPDEKDKRYTQAVFVCAPQVQLDASIVFSQAMHETGGLTSVRWNRDLNPAGISIVADNTKQPFVIPTPEIAAMAHVWCLNKIVKGYVTPPSSWAAQFPLPLMRWLQTVWDAKVNDPDRPPVNIIDDLNIQYYSRMTGESKATYAWDTRYQDLLVDWGNRIFPTLPDAISFPLFKKFRGGPRTYTLVPQSIMRTGPGRTFTARKTLLRDTPCAFIGYVNGQTVDGDDRWLVAGKKNSYLMVHTTGVREQVI